MCQSNSEPSGFNPGYEKVASVQVPFFCSVTWTTPTTGENVVCGHMPIGQQNENASYSMTNYHSAAIARLKSSPTRKMCFGPTQVLPEFWCDRVHTQASTHSHGHREESMYTCKSTPPLTSALKAATIVATQCSGALVI